MTGTFVRFSDPWEHETVVVERGRRSGLPVAVAVHSTKLGPGFGGVRLWTYDRWSDGLADVLRLSAAMTLKNAVAGLEAGGGKSVIPLPPGTVLTAERRTAVFEDLGDVIESLGGRYRAAEDVGTSAVDMATIRTRTSHVVGLPRSAGGVGEPADATAEGVYRSICATLETATRDASPQGRRVTIAGLGHVGSRLARRLSEAGAVLTLADVDQSREALADELGAVWADPATVHTIPADIFCPAGVGGALTPAVIDELECLAVVGPANNQLEASDGDVQLAARGILYAPDFVVNAGGVINIADELAGYHRERALAAVRRVADSTANVLRRAAETGTTTVAAAEALAEARIAAVSGVGRIRSFPGRRRRQ
jgi:leucine dehydrogenase